MNQDQAPNCWAKLSCFGQGDKEIKPSAHEGLVAGDEEKRERACQKERQWVEKRWGGLPTCSLRDFGVYPQTSSKFICLTSFGIIFSLPESRLCLCSLRVFHFLTCVTLGKPVFNLTRNIHESNLCLEGLLKIRLTPQLTHGGT